jgi:hypothetical protein
LAKSKTTIPFSIAELADKVARHRDIVSDPQAKDVDTRFAHAVLQEYINLHRQASGREDSPGERRDAPAAPIVDPIALLERTRRGGRKPDGDPAP